MGLGTWGAVVTQAARRPPQRISAALSALMPCPCDRLARPPLSNHAPLEGQNEIFCPMPRPPAISPSHQRACAGPGEKSKVMLEPGPSGAPEAIRETPDVQ